MASDTQQRTLDRLTTSLGKTGNHKPSFLDFSSRNLPFVKTPLDNLDSNVSNKDFVDEGSIPTMTNEQIIMAYYDLKLLYQTLIQLLSYACRIIDPTFLLEMYKI